MPNPHPKPWHCDSLFGDGPRRPLDREQRARFRFLLFAHYRARRLSPKAERVGLALIKRLGVDGRLDPCHDTLAADVACSARTVRRALYALRTLGLVVWVRRLVRAGWRVAQTRNAYTAYTLALTENPVPLLPVRCGGQRVRETLQIDIPNVRHTALTDIKAAQAALALRRAVIEQKNTQKGNVLMK